MSAVGPANGAQILLAEIPLFAGIAPGAVERLERFMARFEIPSGERLFRQDDHSGRMHVIEHGRLEVQVELPAGQTQALAELGPGELLGETSLLGGGRRTATAVAREPTSGWVLDRAGFEMLRHPGRARAGDPGLSPGTAVLPRVPRPQADRGGGQRGDTGQGPTRNGRGRGG